MMSNSMFNAIRFMTIEEAAATMRSIVHLGGEILSPLVIKNPLHEGSFVLATKPEDGWGKTQVLVQVGRKDSDGCIASGSLFGFRKDGSECFNSTRIERVRPCPAKVRLNGEVTEVPGVLASTISGSRYWIGLGVEDAEWW